MRLPRHELTLRLCSLNAAGGSIMLANGLKDLAEMMNG